MQEFWINMGISVVFGVLDQVIKNPDSKAKYRRVMTKLRDTLNMVFPPDSFPVGSSKVADSTFDVKT